MSALADLADKLALDVIAAADEFGDDELVGEISKNIGALSTTLQEAFATQIRIRMAEKRARILLNKIIDDRRAAKASQAT